MFIRVNRAISVIRVIRVIIVIRVIRGIRIIRAIIVIRFIRVIRVCRVNKIFQMILLFLAYSSSLLNPLPCSPLFLVHSSSLNITPYLDETICRQGMAYRWKPQTLLQDAKEEGEELMVVAVNYRIGALGLLAHGFQDKQKGTGGMNSLQDQLAALKWVQKEVNHFFLIHTRTNVHTHIRTHINTQTLALSFPL